MTKKEKQLRLSELNDYIELQESSLLYGAKQLKELDHKYNDLDREYKMLVANRNRLLEEIVVLTENLDLYSNF
jgi:hypothetical protein